MKESEKEAKAEIKRLAERVVKRGDEWEHFDKGVETHKHGPIRRALGLNPKRKG